ncbi:hypothetical protein AC579_2060 [Pseudocercospora musae]|uniref:AB hydrolase-1 domain-containing protein n=1 Tax=Pseudocercospora musae TaxID=113226 RepID=A0A139I2I7_9PEZI|nr:hypothetical protein AC579_2060 [Pseudocercospora musae]
MELNQVFEYRGWAIKYALLDPIREPGLQSNDFKTAVFVHGTPWSSVTFWPIAGTLLANGSHRVLLYDLPGYGNSQSYKSIESHVKEKDQTHFEGDTSVRFQAEAFSELLQHLKFGGKNGNRAPEVIAHDIAGAIALRAHLIHGSLFSSLLLMDTNTVLPWGDGFYKLVRSEPKVFLQLPDGIYEAMLRAVIRSATFNSDKLKADWEELLAKPWLTGIESAPERQEQAQKSFVRQIAQANDEDVAEMLDKSMYSQVSCPVKMLWGEHDQWIPRQKMESLASMLGDALKEFVVIPNAGHLIMVDQPERVAIEVFSWLSER